MINLVDLLLEQQGKPKAFIMAGAPGAGKGTVIRNLDLGGIKVMNVDDTYIKNLRQANVSLDLKNADADARSKAAQAMAAANKSFKADVQTTIEGRESFILDGTAASVKQTTELKTQLEEAGYDIMMIYVYTDLERSLAQNQDRFEKSRGEDRSLAPAVVMRSWLSVTQNYEPYKNMFGDNFILVANTLDDKMDDVEDIIKKYLEPFKPTNTKPKTPAQQARSDKQYAEMKAAVNQLLKSDFSKDSTSKEEAQSKVQRFLQK